MKRLALWMGLLISLAITLPAFGQQTAETDTLKPEDYFANGVELYEAHDYPAAVAAFGKALELKTDYPEAEYNLAITYWTQKDYPKAISTLESIVKKAPDTDIGKKASADLQKLKAFTIPVVVPKTNTKIEETTKEIDVALKSVPELTADLKFGLLSKRIAATDQLRKAATDEAIDALIKSALNESEKLAVRGGAVQNLARIKNPKALATVDQALAGTSFPTEEKFKLLVVLADQDTPEAFQIILKYWFLEKWPEKMGGMLTTNIMRKEWPPELADPKMWTMTKTLGKEESLPLFISAWPGIVESTEVIIPESQRDYIFYYNLMTGFLKGGISVPVLVQRLKEDYPENSPASSQLASAGAPPPGIGYASPIIKPPSQGIPSTPQFGPGGPPTGFPGQSTSQKTQNWTVQDEIQLRVEMIEVMGGVAGESQVPFLKYLTLNDPKSAVKDAASAALNPLNIRIARSKENYDKGLKLLESGNLDEAISLFEQALKENPDSPYRKNITKNLVSAGFQFLAKGNKERATSLLMPFYQMLSGALAREAANSTPDAAAMGEANISAADTQEKMAKKIISDQLTALEIPSASINAQSIQNIYDLGLKLGIIKKPESVLPGGPMGGPPGGPACGPPGGPAGGPGGPGGPARKK